MTLIFWGALALLIVVVLIAGVALASMAGQTVDELMEEAAQRRKEWDRTMEQ